MEAVYAVGRDRAGMSAAFIVQPTHTRQGSTRTGSAAAAAAAQGRGQARRAGAGTPRSARGRESGRARRYARENRGAGGSRSDRVLRQNHAHRVCAARWVVAAIPIWKPDSTRRAQRRTRAEVQRRTAQLQPFTLTAFGRILSSASGIPVHITASGTLPPSVAGRWLRTAAGDRIEFDAELPDIARINTVLHEAGHILYGHASVEHRVDAGQALCSVLGPAAVAHFAHVRYRSAYDTGSEREAEDFARQTLRTILWSDIGTGESAELRTALGFPRTRIE